MLTNEDHLLKKNLAALALFGLWPYQSQKFLNNRRLRSYHYAFGLCLYCAFFVFLVTEYIELVNVWGDLQDMTTNMSVSCLYTIGVMKIYAMFGHRKKLKKLINGIFVVEYNMIKYQCEEIKQIHAAYITRARRVTYLFWTLTFVTISVFFIVPPLEYQYSSKYHRVYPNGSEYWSYVRPMIFSSWFPFNKFSSYNYVFTFIYQMLMGTVGASYQAIWDTFIVSMMIHSIGQVQILQWSIENITKTDGKDDKKEITNGDIKNNKVVNDTAHMRLVDCVNLHRYILSYVHDLNTITSPVMMLYFAVCSIMLCAIGFQATLYGLSLRLGFMVEYLIALMIQLFMFYWHGNEVLYETSQLLPSTYKCEWYNQSASFKKNLWIMGAGVRLPIQYTVGNFYAMSMSTFVAILRASYSYYTLLRNSQNNKDMNKH